MPQTSYTTGLNAELKCVLALRLKMYRILARRYKTQVGEIDIIAQQGNTIVAIEVKSRSTHETAIQSITPHQQQRIANALEHFLMTHRRYAKCNIRFDVMLSKPWTWPLHIQNVTMSFN